MNILRLTPHFYYTPDVVDGWVVRMDQMGGMQTQIYRQSIALSNKKIKQLVLPIAMPNAPKKWKLNPYLTIQKGNIPMLPIKSSIRGTFGLNFYWGVGVILKLIRKKFKKENYNIIHTHCSGVAAPLIVGYIAKKIFKKPLVYTVHCCRVSTYHPMSKFDSLINGLIIKIEKFCLEHADYTIVLTNKTKEIIQKNYEIPNEKITVIPDVIDSDEFISNLTDKNIQEFQQKYNLDNNLKKIVFIGRIAYEKGCSVLLNAFKKLIRDDCELIFYGDGNERFLLEKEIERMGVQKKCQVTGYLPNTDISLAIKTADLVVMPSLHEEFGGLILEIASVGKAVIGSNIGGIPTLIEDGKSGLLFECGNVEELSKKIDEIIDKSDLLQEYGDELKKNISKKYSFQDNMNKIKKIYSTLGE